MLFFLKYYFINNNNNNNLVPLCTQISIDYFKIWVKLFFDNYVIILYGNAQLFEFLAPYGFVFLEISRKIPSNKEILALCDTSTRSSFKKLPIKNISLESPLTLNQ